MQFFTIVSILSLGLLASAAPGLEVRTGGGGGGDGGSCNASGQKQVCCVGGGILNLICTVTALGSACGNEAFCCSTDAPVGALINIQALNCVNL